MAASRIAGITVEIGGDTTKLSKALSGVNKEIKETQTALKDVDRLLKIDPGNTELLRQKQNDLKNAIQETRDKLQSLQDAAKNSDLGASEHDALQREIIDTQQQLRSLESQYRDFGSVAAQQIALVGEKMQTIGGKISSVGKSISDFGGKLTAGEGGNLDTVSAGLVGTINGIHGAFRETGDYADVFAAACNNSALDVDSLSNAMSVAAPIFSSAGYNVNDAALYMGVMANNGIAADKAANSLKTGIARLVSPGREGAEKMEELGNCSGTTKEMAETMMGGFGGSLEKLKSSIDVLMYSVGEALAPTIQKVVDVVQSLADRLNFTQCCQALQSRSCWQKTKNRDTMMSE